MTKKDAARLVAMYFRPIYQQMVVGETGDNRDYFSVAFTDGDDGYIAEVRGWSEEEVGLVSGPFE